MHHTQIHHTPADGGGEVGGGGWGDEGGLGIGGGVTSPLTKVTIWSTHVRLRVHETLGNTPKKELFVL